MLSTSHAVSNRNNHHVLLDSAGNWNLPRMPDRTVSNGIVAIISSPGTVSSSSLLTSASSSSSSDSPADELLSLFEPKKDASLVLLSCRGSSLCSTSLPERTSLATTSLVANALVVEGITAGDLERGLRHSRHARTLTALFRARLSTKEASQQQQQQRQALILSLPAIITPASTNEGGEEEEEESTKEQEQINAQVKAMLESVQNDIQAVFDAVLAETNERVSLETLYQLHLILDDGATSKSNKV